MSARTGLLRLVVLLGLLAPTTEARADKFDSTLDLSLHTAGGWMSAPSQPFRTPDGDRSVSGSGISSGLLARGNLSLEGVRFGLGLSGLRAAGFESDQRPLTGALWGLGGEVFAGYALGPARGLRPHLELGGSLRRFSASLPPAPGSSSDPATAVALSPGLSGRIGLLFPLNQFFFGDVGVGLGLIGPDRVTFTFGIGLPIPLANLLSGSSAQG